MAGFALVALGIIGHVTLGPDNKLTLWALMGGTVAWLLASRLNR